MWPTFTVWGEGLDSPGLTYSFTVCFPLVPSSVHLPWPMVDPLPVFTLRLYSLLTLLSPPTLLSLHFSSLVLPILLPPFPSFSLTVAFPSILLPLFLLRVVMCGSHVLLRPCGSCLARFASCYPRPRPRPRPASRASPSVSHKVYPVLSPGSSWYRLLGVASVVPSVLSVVPGVASVVSYHGTGAASLSGSNSLYKLTT